MHSHLSSSGTSFRMGRLHLTRAGLAVTTGTATTVAACGLLSLVRGLGAVDVATSVAVTEG